MDTKSLLDSYRTAGAQARTSTNFGDGFVKFQQPDQFIEARIDRLFDTQHGAACDVIIRRGTAVVKTAEGTFKPVTPGMRCAVGLNKAQLNSEVIKEEDVGRMVVIVYTGKATSKKGHQVDQFTVLVRDATATDPKDEQDALQQALDEEDAQEQALPAQTKRTPSAKQQASGLSADNKIVGDDGKELF